jgi:hypothetical protein
MGYGCIHTDQIEWYKNKSKRLEDEYQQKVPGVAFFHIPVPEVTTPINSSKAFIIVFGNVEHESGLWSIR